MSEVAALVLMGSSDPLYSRDPYFLGLLAATLFEVGTRPRHRATFEAGALLGGREGGREGE
jgi:hypothetical protein